MKILVQKFGGTSVSNENRRKLVVNKIIRAKELGFSPVVVVSAIGRKGEPYATDTLLSLISETTIKENSLAVDLLMSCGEIISTVILCDELLKENIECVPMTGGQAGIITDSNHRSASVKELLPDKIITYLKESKIPVVAGFQGIDEKGNITTLGRGGSDVTAALLGTCLNAEEVEIYTDVDGIMTADPRIVSDASLIKEITYNEVFQFADQGAKVIHPRAVEIAMKSNIPLVIKNTLNNCDGTVISNVCTNSMTNLITGITHMNDRVQIRTSFQKASYNNLFNILAENFISLDLINVFPKETIFTIDKNDFNKFKFLAEGLDLTYTYIDECSKIAVIGSRIRGIPGVMARILKALTVSNIEVLQTADSHTTIWCLVESKYTKKAIQAIHNEFMIK